MYPSFQQLQVHVSCYRTFSDDAFFFCECGLGKCPSLDGRRIGLNPNPEDAGHQTTHSMRHEETLPDGLIHYFVSTTTTVGNSACYGAQRLHASSSGQISSGSRALTDLMLSAVSLDIGTGRSQPNKPPGTTE
ncbi:hypothetical protein LX36DRAFT_236101 [Colletotrichum falcatum]|nr:hypothetical protein LX36DRAFT_236101 [Colletotrichum falcatum]